MDFKRLLCQQPLDVIIMFKLQNVTRYQTYWRIESDITLNPGGVPETDVGRTLTSVWTCFGQKFLTELKILKDNHEN